MSHIHIIRKEYFSETSHLRVPKSFIAELGLETTVMLSNLLSSEEFYEKRNQLDKDGWFFQTAEHTEKSTGLDKRHSKKAIDALVEKEYIKYKVSGMPKRRYFQIQWQSIKKHFDNIKSAKRNKLWNSN